MKANCKRNIHFQQSINIESILTMIINQILKIAWVKVQIQSITFKKHQF